MALSDHKINSFEKPVSALADKPQMSAAELKAWFDSNSTGEIKTSINGLIDELAEELGGKVDVSDGKGLIDEVPSDDTIYGRKNGAWSEIIDSLPTINYADIDNFNGVVAVVARSYTTSTTLEGIHYNYKNLLLQYTYYNVYNNNQDSPPYKKQLLICEGGSFKERTYDPYGDADSGTWGDWSEVTHTHTNKTILDKITASYTTAEKTKLANTYTKTEVDNKVNPTVKTSLDDTLTVNTIYDLGAQTALYITLPSGSIGDFIQFDFISGSTAATLTVNSSSGLTGFDLIPATDTVYSLYFDWGAIGYSGNTATYGWRFGYSEYPIEDV